jgi:L-lactate dehydrogenase complex protein LldE
VDVRRPIADHGAVADAVVLFPTCLGDVVAGDAVRDAERVLGALGVAWTRPDGATCCGQPAFNSGHDAPARAVAAATLRALDDGGDAPILVPSGSCSSMLRLHWRELFHGTPQADGAARIARRVRELTSYLAERADAIAGLGPRLDARVGYHDSCHMLRELRLRDEPRAVLGAISGLELVELASSERCCGFGGTFSGRYPEVSVAMADAKIADLAEAGIDVLASADPGCLLQLGGRLSRRGEPVRAVHVVSLLAEALP